MLPALGRSLFANAAALALVLALSHAILKWVSRQPHAGFADLLARNGLPVAFALALYGGVFVWYLHALRTFDMAVLFPTYTGLTLILVALVGVAWFGESIALPQFAGIALIAAGVFLLQPR
jgi:multidrug transporter EmrE-like cation transporter